MPIIDPQDLLRERDELRAENSRLAERWISEQEARVNAQAEIKRLRAVVDAAREFHNFKAPGTGAPGTGSVTKRPCPEDPEKLCGKPIGQYHCPYCGCLQVACIPHMCDPDLCLLENCDCLPEGVSKSRNLIETERLRAALRQILTDPDARVLDSHRDDGWEALGKR